MIYVDQLSVSRGHRQVLSNLTLSLQPGVTGLLGRNGAGKTTLIRALAGPSRRRAVVASLRCLLPWEANLVYNPSTDQQLVVAGIVAQVLAITAWVVAPGWSTVIMRLRDLRAYGDRMAERETGRARELLTVVLGALLVVLGLAFHAAGAYLSQSGPDPLGPGADWEFLRWGSLRLTAWAAVAGGSWLVVRGWVTGR